MVRTALTVLLIATCCFAGAQQRPYYTQYVLNNYILNPAVAGIENYWDIKASHRHQWVGINGAPVTTYFTLQGPLSRNSSGRQTATTVRTPGENPRGHVFMEEYQSTDPHHGVGLTVLNDRTGPINRFSLQGTYAYHIPLNDRISLGGGLSLGIQNVTLRTNELDFGEAYTVDPVVAGSAYINNIRPDISLGIMAYSAKWFAGLGVQQVVPSRISFNDGKLTGDSVTLLNNKLVPHLFLQAGYRILLGEDFSLLPSITAKYVNPVPLSFDINIKLQYRDLIWAGVSARPDDGFAGMLGVNLNSSINIGYSYDYTTTLLNTVSKGTHEIVVGFLLGNKYGDWCPRNVW
ncbi:type IX secretion system membrane protein PorP/SprF [Panacibacter sp. DH6]|uniref:Type IX secretion system membrane protein PorP/SprF n=1 Tax=Panacibacter microcysteis TaxID=2793269 RepID=A0A931EAK7_9BACT|nr:type IX secretion system membrane protein PorP/SprF [Panacibacter microcysteis]MBG9377304.1 type IX secretion system membrane protein PorP/SprF [Panacibacter microcysteis]